ncbi:hypothetical protein D6783_03660 [Candidatus Woesearchaeota archaeon]|nr:MAG: hypothetical protein D6783_03660 [Candidatus Woesearchaeota archaeon]
MGKKGSYFYVIDAFIASAIIIFTILFITRYAQTDSATPQNINVAEDFMLYLQGTDIRDTDSETVADILKSSVVNETGQTLLTLLTELHYLEKEKGCTLCGEQLYNLSKELIEDLIPPAFGARFLMNTTPYYTRQGQTASESMTHFTSQRLTFYQINDSAIFGPLTAHIEVWQ